MFRSCKYFEVVSLLLLPSSSFSLVNRFGSTYPHPELDWKGFHAAVVSQVQGAGTIWSPTRGLEKPWIDINKVKGGSPVSNVNIRAIDWRLVVLIVVLLTVAKLFPNTSISTYAITLSVIVGGWLGFSLRK